MNDDTPPTDWTPPVGQLSILERTGTTTEEKELILTFACDVVDPGKQVIIAWLRQTSDTGHMGGWQTSTGVHARNMDMRNPHSNARCGTDTWRGATDQDLRLFLRGWRNQGIPPLATCFATGIRSLLKARGIDGFPLCEHEELRLKRLAAIAARETTVVIMGYGAPRDPITDGNLTRYLSAAFDHIEELRAEREIHQILFCGGRTNRPDMSEAEAMNAWMLAHRPEWSDEVQILSGGRDIEQNYANARPHIPEHHEVIVFCETSRVPTNRLYAWLAQRSVANGGEWKVIGIPFDARSLRRRHRLLQLVVHPPIEALSQCFPSVALVKRFWRERRITKAQDAFKRENAP